MSIDASKLFMSASYKSFQELWKLPIFFENQRKIYGVKWFSTWLRVWCTNGNFIILVLSQNIFKESSSFEVDFFLLIFAACLTPLGSPVAQNWRVVSPYFFYGLGTAMCIKLLIIFINVSITIFPLTPNISKDYSAKKTWKHIMHVVTDIHSRVTSLIIYLMAQKN